MKKNEEPIIVEQFFNASIESVWNAITNVDQMRQWYFENIPSFKAEVEFETQFNVQSQERNFLHMWKVTEVVPMKKIVYNWK
ncbi:MAG: SRPBCC family protein, partial [Promethearchaeota archaeon]